MGYVTWMHVYMAIQLAIEAVAACILVKLKLEEKMPGAPTMSPEEHRELRKQTFDPVVMIPFPTEQEEQETK